LSYVVRGLAVGLSFIHRVLLKVYIQDNKREKWGVGWQWAWVILACSDIQINNGEQVKDYQVRLLYVLEEQRPEVK
jgi:hypothetical protein